MAEKRDKIHTEIEKTFVNRMVSLGIKPKTKAYENARAEFFTGAMAALSAVVESGEFVNSDEMDAGLLGGFQLPPKWIFGIMR